MYITTTHQLIISTKALYLPHSSQTIHENGGGGVGKWGKRLSKDKMRVCFYVLRVPQSMFFLHLCTSLKLYSSI